MSSGKGNPSGQVVVSALPTPEDLVRLAEAKLAPSPGHTPPRDLHAAFPAIACAALAKPEVAKFFGSRLDTAAVTAAATASREVDAVRTRFENAASLVGRLALGPNQTLEAAASLLNNNWDEFEAAFPQDALALADFRAWWIRNHPGRPHASAAAAQGDAGAEPAASKK